MKLHRPLLTAAGIIAACALSNPVHAINIDQTLMGGWTENSPNPSLTRRGIDLQYFKIGAELGNVIAVGFLYDTAGNQVWFTGNDPQVRPGDITLDFAISTITGGLPIGAEAGSPTANVIGTLSMEINDCNSATVTLDADSLGVNDTFEMSRGEAIGITVGPDRCAYQKPFNGCPAFSDGPGVAPRTCIVSGTLQGNVTFTNNATWVLNGPVFIGSDVDEGGTPATLTVEPGTRIIGAAGNDFLGIQRGSKIIADGTPFAPIVMSGPIASDSPNADAGTWGGLVINGRAPINVCDSGVCTDESEGGAGTFGGNDPNDSSGILRYVRVQFAGFRINDEDELNGIALQGVGRNTVLDYIQVHENADDGIEFFGGTANAKHVLLTDIQDDSLDWTHGWTGNVQYVVVRQNQEANTETERGIEADNFEDNNDALPRSQPKIANVTFVGNSNALLDTTGFLFRRGTGVNMTNAIVTGFDTCLDLDSGATFTAAGTPNQLTGTLTLQNTILNCPNNIDVEASDPFSSIEFFTSQDGNGFADPQLNGIFPPVGAGYTSGFPLDRNIFPDFFDGVDYIGAFSNEETAWTHGWTEFLE
ncbi:MAG: hypothetical protein Tsb002_16130 [Wenzhouxiangellaceae bacterium]